MVDWPSHGCMDGCSCRLGIVVTLPDGTSHTQSQCVPADAQAKSYAKAAVYNGDAHAKYYKYYPCPPPPAYQDAQHNAPAPAHYYGEQPLAT